MEVSATRLNTLQSILTELASEAGFTLLSPFADRHGFPETEFIRPMGVITKSISVAVNPRDNEHWLCEFRVGASIPPPVASFESNSKFVVLNDKPIFNPHASVAQNKKAFSVVFRSAVTIAHDSYDIVSRQEPVEHNAASDAVVGQAVTAASLKVRSHTHAAPLLAKAR